MMRSGRSIALYLAIPLLLLLPGTGSAPSTSGGEGREALLGILHQLLHVGTQAYNRGDFTFASSCFRTVARAEKDAGKDGPGMSSHAQIFEGNSLVRKGKLAGALHRYRRALESVQGLGIQGTLPSMCRENIKHIEKARSGQLSGLPNAWSGERYLVFRFWAGLSNRRQELVGMVGAARLLNRTLVLPPLVENRWMASHKEDRPPQGVGEFYDLSVLRSYVSIIDQADFVHRIVPSLPLLSAELHIRDYQYIGQLSHMGLGWNNASVVAPDLVQQPRIPSDVVSMFGSSKSPVLAIDFSYRFLDLGFKGEFEYFDGLKEWTPPHVKVDFDPTPLHSEILQSLAFHPAIISAAVNAIRQGRAEEEPFLAVHLRRNDMKNWVNRQHAWPSTDSVIEQILNITSKLDIKRVFLATDTDDAERAALLSSLPGAFFTEPPSGFSEAQAAIFDQAVCARASAFIGNFWSTFSLAIIEERSKRGFGRGTDFFFQAPFPGSAPGDVRDCGNAAATTTGT